MNTPPTTTPSGAPRPPTQERASLSPLEAKTRGPDVSGEAEYVLLPRRRAGSEPSERSALRSPLANPASSPALTPLSPPTYDEATRLIGQSAARGHERKLPSSLASDVPALRLPASATAPTSRPEIQRALPLLLAAKLALRDSSAGPRAVEMWLGGSAAHRALGLLGEHAWVDDLDPLMWVEARGDVSSKTLAAQVVPAIEQRLAVEQMRAKVIVTYLEERERPDEDIVLVQVLGAMVHIDLRIVASSCRRRLYDIAANALLVDFFRAERIGATPGVPAQRALEELRAGIYRDIAGLRRDGMVRLWRAHQKGFVPAGERASVLADAKTLAATLLRHIHPSPWAEAHQLHYERGIWANRLVRMQGSRPLAPLLGNALLSLAPLGDAHPLVAPLHAHLAEMLRQRCLDEPEPSAQLAALLSGRLGVAGLALWSWALAEPQSDALRTDAVQGVAISTPQACTGGAVRICLPDTSSFMVVPYDIGTWLSLGAEAAATPLAQLLRLAEEKDDATALAQLLGHPKLTVLLPDKALQSTEKRLRVVTKLLSALQIGRAMGHGAAWQERLMLAVARVVPWHALDASLETAEPISASLRRHVRRIAGSLEQQSFSRLLRELEHTHCGPALEQIWLLVSHHVRQLEPSMRAERLRDALLVTSASFERLMSQSDVRVRAELMPEGDTSVGLIAALGLIARLEVPTHAALGEEVWRLLRTLLRSKGAVPPELLVAVLELAPASLAAFWRAAPVARLAELDEVLARCERDGYGRENSATHAPRLPAATLVSRLWLQTATVRGVELLSTLTPAAAQALASQQSIAEQLISLFAQLPFEEVMSQLMHKPEAVRLFALQWTRTLEEARKWLVPEHLALSHPFGPLVARLVTDRPGDEWAELAASWLVACTKSALEEWRRDEKLARNGLITVLNVMLPNHRAVFAHIDEHEVLLGWVGLVASFDDSIGASPDESIAKMNVLSALRDDIALRDDAKLSALALSVLSFYGTPHGTTERHALDMIAQTAPLLESTTAWPLGELLIDSVPSVRVRREIARIYARAAGAWCVEQPKAATSLIEQLAAHPPWQAALLRPEALPKLGSEPRRRLAEAALMEEGAQWFKLAPVFALRAWHAICERALAHLGRTRSDEALERVLALFLWRTERGTIPGDELCSLRLKQLLGDEALRDSFELKLQQRLEHPSNYATTRSALVPLYLLSMAAPREASERRESASVLIDELLRTGALGEAGELGLNPEARSQLGLHLTREIWSGSEQSVHDNSYRLNWQGFVGMLLEEPVPQPWLRASILALSQRDAGALRMLISIVQHEFHKLTPRGTNLSLALEARFVDLLLICDALLELSIGETSSPLLQEQLIFLATSTGRLTKRASALLNSLLMPLISAPLPIDLTLAPTIGMLRQAAKEHNERRDGRALHALEKRLAETRSAAFANFLSTPSITEQGYQLDAFFDGTQRLPLAHTIREPSSVVARLVARWAHPVSLHQGCEHLMASLSRLSAPDSIELDAPRVLEQGWPYLIDAALAVQPGGQGILVPLVTELCLAPPSEEQVALIDGLLGKLTEARARAQHVGLALEPATEALRALGVARATARHPRHRAWLNTLSDKLLAL